MKQIEFIRNHPKYQASYERTKELEKDRIFCRHQMTHLMDVARIAYIQNLEQGLGFSKEVIYAAAILHDIGKYRQYEDKTPHEVASEEIAREILQDLPEEIAFPQEEMDMILQAIRSHRRMQEDMTPLDMLLYTSDKMSRNCFACEAERECNWSEDKKNMEIKI